MLKPPHHLTSIEYNPKDEYVVGAGMQNGQLAFFDTRRASTAGPVDLSSMWSSHRDPVCRLHWIVSKAGNECMSAATDGQVEWTRSCHYTSHLSKCSTVNKSSPKVIWEECIALAQLCNRGGTKY